MRRSGSLVLLLLVAACQSGGVEIIVYPSGADDAERVDAIRMYVGIGYPDQGLHGSQRFPPRRDRSGVLWLGEPGLSYDEFPLTHADQPARFVYAARGDGEKLTVIAVGMTKGQPTSAVAKYMVDVPSDHVEVHAIGLNPASRASVDNFENNQLELWGPNPGDETCAQLVDTRTDHDNLDFPISLVTTHGDADCDGFGTFDKAECDDHFYKANVVPSTTNLTCLDDTPFSIPGNSTLAGCRVGGLLCQDGAPTSRVECSVDHPYCAPQTLCEHCPDSLGDNQFDECAIDPVATDKDGTLGHIECQLPTGRTNNGTIAICPHTLILYPPFMPASGTPCSNGTFHGPRKEDSWSSTIHVGGGEYEIGAGGTMACALALTTVKVPDRFSDFPSGGLLAVDVKPDVGGVVPIVFKARDPGTGVQLCPPTPAIIPCTAVGVPTSDSVRYCVEFPPIPQ